MNKKHGLSQDTIQKITQILTSHKEVSETILYGSRAKGNYKPGSDIDLTLKGNLLTLEILSAIEHQLDELNLPYSIDISIFKLIDNKDLIAHINRIGKEF